jgi:uncharacterized RDD family membrane protein YckC
MDQGNQSHSCLIANVLLPASPWRRLAAAALDALVLLFWNALVFLLAVGIAPESAPRAPLPLIGMLSALAYMAVGWAFWGMTLGKWALGIRVVAADGRKLSWMRALGRVGAFLLASAPLKAGFAAVLWDEKRRGWHDRLAGTLVVTWRKAAAPPRDSSPLGRCASDGGAHDSASSEPPRPPSSRRGHLVAVAVLALYLLLAVGLTMPLARNFSTHCPGAEVEGLNVDGYVFLWDYWWVRTALTQPGLRVMSTRYLFWPHEVGLRYHTLVLLHSAIAAPLQDALSLIETYNLLLLFSLAACAWGAFLLCRYLTGSTAAAAVAGLAFGFCPYLTTHALAHQNLIAAEWLAPFAYFVLRGLREHRLRYVVGAGVCWALVGLCEWYYFLYAGMLLAVLLACEVAARPRRWSGALAAACGVVALTMAALSPLLVPMLAERAHGGYMQQPLARPAALGAQPGLYITPAFTHPLLGNAGSAVLRSLATSRAEGTLYLGVTVIALALTGLAYRRRHLVPWIAGGAFFLLLALGPQLRLGQRTQFNAMALLLIGGPPGNGFDLPLSAGLSARLAMEMVGGGGFLGAQDRIALPYLWLWHYLPVTRLAAVPTRAALPGMLCLVVLAAAGLAAILDGLGRRRRLIITGIAAGLVLFEFLPVPYPIRDLRVPRFYHQLAGRDHRAHRPRERQLLGGDFAVAEVPLLGDYAQFMYYQTVHHKPILTGLVSRQPPHALDFIRGNALLRELQPDRTRPPGEPVLYLTRSAALARSLPELRAAYGPALAQARDTGVGLIVAHREMLTPADLDALGLVLCDALGLTPIREGEGIVAYYLRAKPAKDGPVGAATRASRAR